MRDLLLVEDDPRWRKLLYQMYKEILPDYHIELAESGREAMNFIEKKRKFDFISLDINLSLTNTSNINGVNGMTVLTEARKQKACNAVIMITGLPYDENLADAIPDEEDREKTKINIVSLLNQEFDRNQLLFFKSNIYPPESCVENFKVQLPKQRILDLCDNPCWSYVIEVYDETDISIKRKGTRRSQTVRNEQHARLLSKLVDKSIEKFDQTDKTFVSQTEICEIYYPEITDKYSKESSLQVSEKTPPEISKAARRGISDIKRYLKDSMEIVADDVFVVEHRKGCKLAPTTTYKLIERK